MRRPAVPAATLPSDHVTVPALLGHVAAPGDVIVSDAPGVVAYYLEGSGRPDLGVRSLSAEGLPSDNRPAFVIVQPEHLTFENRETVTHLQRESQPWRQFYADDALTAQVFRYPRS